MVGMEPGTEGLKGIAEIAPPTMYTQVRKFLGATGYFCRFIKGYAKIAKPLNNLLQGENSKLKAHPVEIATKSPGSIPGAQDEMFDGARAGLCGLQEALPIRNRRIDRGPGSRALPRTGRWSLPPGGLCQPWLERRRDKIPFL